MYLIKTQQWKIIQFQYFNVELKNICSPNKSFTSDQIFLNNYLSQDILFNVLCTITIKFCLSIIINNDSNLNTLNTDNKNNSIIINDIMKQINYRLCYILCIQVQNI